MKNKKEERKLTEEQRRNLISLINNPGIALDENGHEIKDEAMLLDGLEEVIKEWENLKNNEIN